VITDFDTALFVGDDPFKDAHYRGTSYYDAPEVTCRASAEFSYAVDVWGAGVTFLELVRNCI
jgi:serine/threonine protein kinase